jgi:hypothetical protein
VFIRVNQCLKNEIGPFVPSCPHKGPWGLSGYESIMQNKANFKMGNINISTARAKAYDREQRTMSNERYPKQTQSNPIPRTQDDIRYPAYDTRNSSPAFSQPRSSQRFVCADLFPIIYLGGFHRSIVRHPPLMREWPPTDWTARRSVRPSISTAC